jgi:hypothetical protein
MTCGLDRIGARIATELNQPDVQRARPAPSITNCPALESFCGETMKLPILVLICCCLISPCASLANDRTPQNSSPVSLTPDQAIAAARSYGRSHKDSYETKPKGRTSFEIIREIDANAQTREVARQAREAAAALHVKVHEEYLYLDLLERGGYLILQVQVNTGNALMLYLVSTGADGRPAVVPRPLPDDKISGSLTRELITKNAEFVGRLYDTPLSDISKLKSSFEGGSFPEYNNEDAWSFFAAPGVLRKTAADESAVQELAGLMGVCMFWWTRNAVTMPVYAANPMFALKTALDKHEALTKEFARKNNLDPNFVYVLDASESSRTPPKLQDLVARYQRLDEFLESAVQPQCATSIFAVNKSLSNIGLYLGLDTSYGKDTYVIMTEPALGVHWKRGSNADWRVSGVMCLAESSNFDEE